VKKRAEDIKCACALFHFKLYTKQKTLDKAIKKCGEALRNENFSKEEAPCYIAIL